MIKLFAYMPVMAGLLIAPMSAPASAQTNPPAALAPPSPAGAAALQAQFQAALDRLVAKPAKLPNPLAQVTAADDHYALSVLLAPLVRGLQPQAAAFTAKLRPLDGGWAVDDEQWPTEFEIVTAPPATGAPAAGNVTPPTTYQVKLGAQDEHATVNQHGQAASTGGGSIASIDIVKTGGTGATLTHYGRITNQTSVQAVAPGVYDGLSDVAVAGYAGKSANNQINSETTAERLHAATTLTGISVTALNRVSQDLLREPRLSMPAAGKLTPAGLARWRGLVVASEGLVHGIEIAEDADSVKFEVAGHSGGFDRAELSFSGQAPQDTLSASLGITLLGLRLDEVPPALAAYVPTRIALRPTASNLNVADLTRLVLDGLTPDPTSSPPPGSPRSGSADPAMAKAAQDYQVLFSHGGVQVGFDQLAIDMAGAQLSGNGSFTLTGPQSVSGAAQITAHGLDELIARLQGDPVAAKAAGVLILLKGIAKTTPDGAVWQVTVQDRKVLVNGLDLAALAGALGR